MYFIAYTAWIEIWGGTGAPYSGIQMSVVYLNKHSEVLCGKTIVFIANHLEVANKCTNKCILL